MSRAFITVTAIFGLILLAQEGAGFWLWETSDVFADRHEVGFDLMCSAIMTPLIWLLIIRFPSFPLLKAIKQETK